MADQDGKTYEVTPELVAAAKLRETINTRLGKPTAPAISKIARAQPSVRTA